MWGNPEDDPEYITRDSGEKAVHSDGVQRDTQKGKRLFTLMFPRGVPLAQQLFVRVADLYTRGAEKYGDRNWENSKSQDTLDHHEAALWRHFMNFYFDVQDGEDHAAAIVWNINAVELCRRNLQGSAPDTRLTDEDIARAVERAEHRLDLAPDVANFDDQGCFIGFSHMCVFNCPGPHEPVDPDAVAVAKQRLEEIRTRPDYDPNDPGVPRPQMCDQLPSTTCPGGSCGLSCQMTGFTR
jgi:hypothetical protein